MTRLSLLLFLVSSAVYGQAVEIAPGLILGPERRVAEFRVSASPNGEQLAGLVPEGTDLLAVWIRRGYYAGGSFTYIPSALRSVLIDANGRPRPETSRLLVEERWIDRAFADRTDAGAVVVWSAGSKTYGERIGGTPHLIADGRLAGGLKCSASRCAISWDASFSSTFTIIDSESNVIRDSIDAPQLNVVAADPNGFLFAGVRGEQVVAARVDNAGQQLFEVSADRPFFRPLEIAADFDGNRYLVAWTSVSSLWASTLSTNGTMSSPARVFDNPHALQAIAWNGSQHLALLSLTNPCGGYEGTICPTTLYTLPIDSNLSAKALQIQPLTTQGNAMLPAALIANSGSFYAAMGYNTNQRTAPLLLSRIAADGSPASREPISLAPQSQSGAVIAAAGDHHVVFWEEFDAANGKSLLLYSRDDGVSRGDTHILAGQATIGDFRVATVGSDILVVWPEDVPSRYRALIMHPDGSTSPADAPPYTNAWVTTLAGSETAWLFASGKRATLISRAGVNLAPQSIQFSDIDSQTVAAASDGEHFLIVSSGGKGMNMTLVNADGSIAFMDRKLFDINPSRLSLSWNGHEYMVGVGSALQRLDSNGNPLGNVLVLTEANVVSYVPLRDSWLVSFWTDGHPFGFRIKDGRQIEPAFPMEPPIASVLNRDGSATAMFARVVDAPPFGSAPAVFLREIRATDFVRRRAIGAH
ncbi:MAG TPA: hypothetical protein VII32_18900 [Thermoanaerobaculia bacterium]